MSKFYNGFTIGRLFFILNMIVQPNFYIAMIHLLLSTLAMMGLTFLIGFFVAAVIKLIAYAADSFDFIVPTVWNYSGYDVGGSIGRRWKD